MIGFLTALKNRDGASLQSKAQPSLVSKIMKTMSSPRAKGRDGYSPSEKIHALGYLGGSIS